MGRFTFFLVSLICSHACSFNFSFTFGGTPSNVLLENIQPSVEPRGNGVVLSTWTIGHFFSVSLETRSFPIDGSYPSGTLDAAENLLRFQWTGPRASPKICLVNPYDVELPRAASAPVEFYTTHGSNTSARDWAVSRDALVDVVDVDHVADAALLPERWVVLPSTSAVGDVLASLAVDNHTACAAAALRLGGIAADLSCSHGSHSPHCTCVVLSRVAASVAAARHQVLQPPQAALTRAPVGGRSSDTNAPLFTVGVPVPGRNWGGTAGGGDALGVAVALGWSGNWRYSAALRAGGLHLTVGHGEFLCTSLHAGESIRSTTVLVLRYNYSHAGEDAKPRQVSDPSLSLDALRASPPFVQGGTTGPFDGFNAIRRNSLLHRSPREATAPASSKTVGAAAVPSSAPSGQPLGSIVAVWSWIGYTQCPNLTLTSMLSMCNAARNATIDAVWLDAGWFPGCFPNGVGNWVLPVSKSVNVHEFKQASLIELAQCAHGDYRDVQFGGSSSASLNFVVWFEPERGHVNTSLPLTHPEFYLQRDIYDGVIYSPADWLLNLGNPAARSYIIEFITSAIDAWQIDVFRTDYNIFPAGYWVVADLASGNSTHSERTGFTENQYITGLYEYWSTILAIHQQPRGVGSGYTNPRFFIDDCASGGRRIDLETISRSIPLWRSDWQGAPEDHQVAAVGLSYLAPVNSGAVADSSAYAWRSAGLTGKAISWGPQGWPADTYMADAMAEVRIMERCALEGLIWPVALPVPTLVADAYDSWAAWQCMSTNSATGVVMGYVLAFRRAKAPPQVVLPLRPFPPGRYRATLYLELNQPADHHDYDSSELANVTFTLRSVNTSALITYEPIL